MHLCEKTKKRCEGRSLSCCLECEFCEICKSAERCKRTDGEGCEKRIEIPAGRYVKFYDSHLAEIVDERMAEYVRVKREGETSLPFYIKRELWERDKELSKEFQKLGVGVGADKGIVGVRFGDRLILRKGCRVNVIKAQEP